MKINRTLGDYYEVWEDHDDGTATVRLIKIKEYDKIRYKYLLLG